MDPRGYERAFKAVIELPNTEREDYAYETFGWFYTKEEAIKWAQEHLGADEEGRICVVSTF